MILPPKSDILWVNMNGFSVIIPIYNEEQILKKQVSKLLSQINRLKLSAQYEIILVENGSTDNTFKLAEKLARKYKRIKTIKINQPSYGQAFRTGIKKAQYEIVFQFDIDFWDVGFIKKSLSYLKNYHIIIGSKNLDPLKDKRPFFRKLFSFILEVFINKYFKINLSDTHGMKAIKKEKILPLINSVHSPNHFFDTELLIHCYYLGYRFKEIPVRIKEIRTTRFPYHLRLFQVLSELIQLVANKKRIVRGVTLKTTPISQEIALSNCP